MLHLFAIASTVIGAVLLWRYVRGLVASMRQAAVPQRLDGEMQAVEEEGIGEPGELALNHVQSREGRDEVEPAQETDADPHIYLCCDSLEASMDSVWSCL